MEINKAAVIGSGVMGGGIAAHLANAGVPVLLYDIVPEGANDRSIVARKAIDRHEEGPTPRRSCTPRRFAKMVTPVNRRGRLGPASPTSTGSSRR